jgi:hypothetical protein
VEIEKDGDIIIELSGNSTDGVKKAWKKTQ